MRVEEAIKRVESRFPFQRYVELERESGVYENIASLMSRHVPSGAKLLDFGSGPCDKTAVLQEMGWSCFAVDDLQDEWHLIPGNREKILQFASESGIQFHLADGSPLPYQPESFDVVLLTGVVEHLHDSPRQLLSMLLELVKPGGLLMVSVPNAVNVRKRLAVLLGRSNYSSYDIFYWYPGPWRGHIREYTLGDLAQLAEYLGLEVVELRGCDHMLQRVPAGIRPVYRAVTNVFHGLKDSLHLVARKGADWRPRPELSAEELRRIMQPVSPFHYS